MTYNAADLLTCLLSLLCAANGTLWLANKAIVTHVGDLVTNTLSRDKKINQSDIMDLLADVAKKLGVHVVLRIGEDFVYDCDSGRDAIGRVVLVSYKNEKWSFSLDPRDDEKRVLVERLEPVLTDLNNLLSDNCVYDSSFLIEILTAHVKPLIGLNTEYPGIVNNIIMAHDLGKCRLTGETNSLLKNLEILVTNNITSHQKAN